MAGDFKVGGKKILNIRTLKDHKEDDPYEIRVKDLYSAVNKEYLNEKFLKVDKDSNDFDLKQKTIKNCEPYYDGLFSDNDLVSKAFVDVEIGKLPKPETDVLKLDGSKAMAKNLDMGGNSIINIKPFVEDDSSGAASDTQKNEAITFGYFKDQRGKLEESIKKVSDNALNRKNPGAMESNIDMDQHSITNLKNPKLAKPHMQLM